MVEPRNCLGIEWLANMDGWSSLTELRPEWMLALSASEAAWRCFREQCPYHPSRPLACSAGRSCVGTTRCKRLDSSTAIPQSRRSCTSRRSSSVGCSTDCRPQLRRPTGSHQSGKDRKSHRENIHSNADLGNRDPEDPAGLDAFRWWP